jgi:hypothetical protein
VAELDTGGDLGLGGDARRRLGKRLEDLRQALDALG